MSIQVYKPLLGRSDFIQRLLVCNPLTDPQDFLSDPLEDVRVSAALRHLTLAQQKTLVRDPSPKVRAFLAHKRTDISIWCTLAKDSDVNVRRWIASRREIPPEVQEILLLDCLEVRRALARNPHTMWWIVEKLKDVA
jgi:hypothetical protein